MIAQAGNVTSEKWNH